MAKTMINSLSQKAKTAAYYLSHPNTYPFLTRLVRTKLLGGSMSLDRTKDKAAKWCQEQAVSTEQAIHSITCKGQSTPIRSLFASTFEQADIKSAACPQEMGGAGNLDLLYTLTQHFNAVRVLETGVAYGWSSLAILLAISQKPQAHLVSTNLHYSRYDDDSYVGCVVPDDLKQCWTVVREADRTALPKALAILPEYDLCHYDSDKTYAGRIWAYPLLWESLKVGGCFISDDVGDNLAFAHFCRMIHTTPIIVKMPSSSGEKYVGILFKKSNTAVEQIMF